MKAIKEGNKVIAEFIGERTERTKNIESEKWQVKLTSPDGTVGYWPYGSLPPFHSSYDWLIPVLQKIGKMGYWWRIDCCSCRIGKLGQYADFIVNGYDEQEGKVNTCIATWKSVIEFINKHKAGKL